MGFGLDFNYVGSQYYLKECILKVVQEVQQIQGYPVTKTSCCWIFQIKPEVSKNLQKDRKVWSRKSAENEHKFTWGKMRVRVL